MDRIQELLERYWQCETSVEEERELRGYFSRGDIPLDAAGYQALFDWKEKNAGLVFEKEPELPKMKRMDFSFYSLMKAAAVVLIFLSIGIGINTHYQQDKKIDQMLSESFTDPHEAVRETEEIVAKVSSLLRQIEEQSKQTTDSLVVHE